MLKLAGKRIGVALTGSYCTMDAIFPQLARLKNNGAELFPIMSPAVQDNNTRFGTAAACREQLTSITGKRPWLNIVDVEPIGPQKLIDLLLIAPCTGNTMAKLANSIIDTAVLMAAKAHLRNGGPVLLFISTNDGLGLNSMNLATLLITKNIYMVPFGQDNPMAKPNSLISKPDLILPAVEEALLGRQLQPVLVQLE